MAAAPCSGPTSCCSIITSPTRTFLSFPLTAKALLAGEKPPSRPTSGNPWRRLWCISKGRRRRQTRPTTVLQHGPRSVHLLLAPELQRLMPRKGSLVIVPDDALVFVPFEVLLRLPAADENWRDLPWLLADYNTAYAYSATLLQMQQTISCYGAPRGCAICIGRLCAFLFRSGAPAHQH